MTLTVLDPVGLNEAPSGWSDVGRIHLSFAGARDRWFGTTAEKAFPANGSSIYSIGIGGHIGHRDPDETGQTEGVQSFDQQQRWLRDRARRSLDPTAPGFGRSGLLERLNGAGVGVIVLPADDLAQPIEFADELLSRIPERFVGYAGNGVGTLDQVTTTSESLVRYAPDFEGEGWRGFVAVRRSGGVECGVGSNARYVIPEGVSSASGHTVLRLPYMAHLIRVAVDLQVKVIDWAHKYTPDNPVAGPFEIIVAVPDAEGMVLGALAQGWEQPEQAHFVLPPHSVEANVMVRLQVEEWPTTDDGIAALMFRTLDRACQAFGERQRRYLNNNDAMPNSYA